MPTLITDRIEPGYEFANDVEVFLAHGQWSQAVAQFANTVEHEAVLLMQEDFFLTAPVKEDLIVEAMIQLHEQKAGCVRLYPCPGSDEEYGNLRFGSISRGAPYRISCQAAIWRPSYLSSIASQFSTAAEFELRGTPASCEMPEDVLSIKRESSPWPMEYLCSAISRGLWNPDAKRLCDQHGIVGDWSMRAFA